MFSGFPSDKHSKVAVGTAS